MVFALGTRSLRSILVFILETFSFMISLCNLISDLIFEVFVFVQLVEMRLCLTLCNVSFPSLRVALVLLPL